MRPATIFGACLAILGIAALGAILVLPRGSSVLDRSPHTAALADINGGIKMALRQYQLDIGSYPQSLQALLRSPADAHHWHGPYLDRIPIDPWGNPYIYTFPGRGVPGTYDLISAGPDGKEGTDDDIVGWQ